MNLHRPAWYALVCNHTVHFRLYIIRSFGTESTRDTIIIVKESRHKQFRMALWMCTCLQSNPFARHINIYHIHSIKHHSWLVIALELSPHLQMCWMKQSLLSKTRRLPYYGNTAEKRQEDYSISVAYNCQATTVVFLSFFSSKFL